MLDLFGRGFTLLRFGGADGEALIAAAREAALPLNVADITDDADRALYERRLVLVAGRTCRLARRFRARAGARDHRSRPRRVIGAHAFAAASCAFRQSPPH